MEYVKDDVEIDVDVKDVLRIIILIFSVVYFVLKIPLDSWVNQIY